MSGKLTAEERLREALQQAIAGLGVVSVICFDKEDSPRKEPGDIARATLAAISNILGPKLYDTLADKAASLTSPTDDEVERVVLAIRHQRLERKSIGYGYVCADDPLRPEEVADAKAAIAALSTRSGDGRSKCDGDPCVCAVPCPVGDGRS